MSCSTNPRIFALLALAAALSVVVGHGESVASDLANRTNILMYPKPVAVSAMVLKNAAGQNVAIGDFKGRVVLLRFSSINCPACKIEEPLLEQLRQRFKPSELEIVGVNLVDNPSDIVRHSMVSRAPYPTLFDGGGGFRLKVVEMGDRRTSFVLNPGQEAIFEVPGFPTTYIIDCRGQAVGYSVGPARWDDTAALGMINGLMQDRSACFGRQSRLGGPTHLPR